MDFNLVEFACDANDKIQFYLLDEAKYDDWCNAEPQQGYKHFKLIWSGDIQQILARNDLKDIFVDCNKRDFEDYIRYTIIPKIQEMDWRDCPNDGDSLCFSSRGMETEYKNQKYKVMESYFCGADFESRIRVLDDNLREVLKFNIKTKYKRNPHTKETTWKNEL